MRRSIATVCLSGTLEEKLAAAARVGFDGVEIFESDLVCCPLPPAEVRRRTDDLGLGIVLYQPFRDFEALPPELLERNLRRAEHKFTVMADLGVDLMLVCSNVAPTALDDDDLAAEQLHRLADRAADSGVRIAYEALAWGRHVADYTHAWKIVDAADHPNLGVCLDSFHILSRRSDPAGIRDIPRGKIFFVQLSDAIPILMDVLQWSRHYRCFPGQGGFDLTGFVEHVLAAGYRGPLSLEVFNDVLRQADAERTATDALRSLIALEESLKRRLEAPTAWRGDAAGVYRPVEVHDRIELAAPPAPVEPSGFAFVEITVDALAEMAVELLLRRMGFIHVASHRSKAVRMWQQGEARVLLNRTRPSNEDWPRGAVAVSAIAVESAEPARSADRAQQLLAPATPRSRGPGEADLFATAAPDGTEVFFCRTAPAAVSCPPSDGWLGDFDPQAIDILDGVQSLTRVDHVALSQPPYYFDEAALFYQSVLGLHRRDSVDVADPYGLVRSRALTSSGAGIRLVLTVPAIGGGMLPESAHFQHIAFACDDIFAAARAMRNRELPVVAIPGNYYDDLAARFDLDGSRLDAMRAVGILYDRDGYGEFFHFYTATFGRRIFFEIVQRVNGYDGYGASNTPVRIVAQYRHMAMAGLIPTTHDPHGRPVS
jgi:4-hydroxyphenylpyruvate dioxygenase